MHSEMSDRQRTKGFDAFKTPEFLFIFDRIIKLCLIIVLLNTIYRNPAHSAPCGAPAMDGED